MKNEVKNIILSTLILPTIFLVANPLAAFVVAQETDPNFCEPEHYAGAPIYPITYDYGPDGLVRFHFTITEDWGGVAPGYLYGNEACDHLWGGTYHDFSGTGLWTNFVGIRHLLMKAAINEFNGYYWEAYDEDTMQPYPIVGMPPSFGHPFASLWFANPGYGSPWAQSAFVRVKDYNYGSKTPVLIVPGVLGTELFKGEEELWANPKMSNPFGDDSFMDPLQFGDTLQPSDVEVYYREVIKQKPFFDYTESLINEFVIQGYIENQDLFTFPYDWRYGVSQINIDALRNKIDQILQQTNASKIDIVAHSTGGLLVKKYVMDNPTDHHIQKAVLVGVPNTGAPKAVKVLLAGDNFGVMGLSDAEMKKIAQNLPVVYDLTPSQQYYNNKGSYFRIIKQKFLAPDIAKDLNQQETLDWLIYERGKNQTAYSNAANLHTAEFDNFDLRTQGVELYNIVGCKTGTIGKVIEKDHGADIFGNPIVEYLQPEEVPGDGTVPLESATNLPVDEARKFYALKTDHGKMLSQSGIRQQIVNIIAGSNLGTGSKITQNINDCKLKGKAVSIYSPLDIEAISAQGQRLGLADDGSLQNDIPGADFHIFGEHKFVFLPEDEAETYTINLSGTGDGVFTLSVDNIDDNQTTQSQNFINIPVSTTTLGSLQFVNDQVQVLLDNDGDGNIDGTLTPTSVLNNNESQDFIAPISTSTITGLMGNLGFYRSDVNISLSVEDPIIQGEEEQTSGLLKTMISLDSAPFEAYQNPMSVFTEGGHTLSFYSTDRAGNNEISQTINFTIDKTPPEFEAWFNFTGKAFQFAAKDNLDSNPLISCGSANCQAIDAAGNLAALNFKKTKVLNLYSLLLNKISYNGVSSNFPENLFSVGLLGKNLQNSAQAVVVRKQQLAGIAYSKEKNESLIAELQGNGIIKTYTLSGLHLIKLKTEKQKISAGIE